MKSHTSFSCSNFSSVFVRYFQWNTLLGHLECIKASQNEQISNQFSIISNQKIQIDLQTGTKIENLENLVQNLTQQFESRMTEINEIKSNQATKIENLENTVQILNQQLESRTMEVNK